MNVTWETWSSFEFSYRLAAAADRFAGSMASFVALSICACAMPVLESSFIPMTSNEA